MNPDPYTAEKIRLATGCGAAGGEHSVYDKRQSAWRMRQVACNRPAGHDGDHQWSNGTGASVRWKVTARP